MSVQAIIVATFCLNYMFPNLQYVKFCQISMHILIYSLGPFLMEVPPPAKFLMLALVGLAGFTLATCVS